MQKSCAVCGNSFEAKRARAMYCSGRCQKRAQRQPSDDIADTKTDSTRTTHHVELPPGLTAVTMAKLESAERLDTPEGQAALVLAVRIETGAAETGSAIASLVRQLHATLAEALKGAEDGMDEVDELRARRERKLGSG